ncbi:LysR family transcriptional regulator [Catenovulum sediminis]|uniref:LysR substrate-binding domain-containing protein n=1 Tax=Catenovulum sediminis TaxID=1740262 RepID=A0ABV1RHL9_9ALTE|nr:LysR family transcriptional regulator [Catenovulum sediminis]
MMKGLNEFIMVVEQGNFSSAAEKLGTTRARVSQVIAELELNLGTQLFKRSTRSMQLTSIGQAFYQQSRQGLIVLEQAVEQVKVKQNQLAGNIKVNSVGGLFAEQILAPVIMDFMQQYPNINIELDFSSDHIDLIADKYDLAVRMGDLPDSNLIARPLVYYPSYVCASADYLNQFAEITHPKYLEQHRCIVGSMKKWTFYQDKKDIKGHKSDKYEIHVEGQLVCANGHIAKQAALKGCGIVRLPAYYVAQEIEQGILQPAVKHWQTKGSQVSLVYAKTDYRAARLQLFIEYLCNVFRNKTPAV